MNLVEFQDWVWSVYVQKGWNENKPVDEMNLLTEEVGELAREVRRNSLGRHCHEKEEKFDSKEKKEKLKEELGDVLSNVSAIAKMYDVGLEECAIIYQEKMKKNYNTR